jgi:hypothetical protein
MLTGIIQFAGSITGTRFRLIAASSAIATAAIIGTTMTSANNLDWAAALAARLNGLQPPAPAASEPSEPVPAPPVVEAAATTPAAPVSAVPSSVPSFTPTPSTPTRTKKEPQLKPSRVKHVFVVTLASPGYDQTWGDASEMPYLAKTLRPQGQLLSNYSTLTPRGLPNWLATVGGQQPNALTSADCQTFSDFPASSRISSKGFISGDGCVYPPEVLSVADQITSARLKWKAYLEDQGNPEPNQTTPSFQKNCVRPARNQADSTQQERTGTGYAVRHNPFAYFRSLTDLGGCNNTDVNFDSLAADLSGSATPNYVFIQPNLCNAGSVEPCLNQEPGGPPTADAFLAKWVPLILASPAYKRDGALIITFGESTDANASGPQRTGALLLSRFLAAGSERTEAFTPYSLLRTTEELLGLQKLAAANRGSTRSFSDQLAGTGSSSPKL